MINVNVRAVTLVAVAALVAPFDGVAEPQSTLQRFEADATTPSETPPPRRSVPGTTYDDDDDDDSVAEDLFWWSTRKALEVVVFGGAHSFERISPIDHNPTASTGPNVDATTYARRQSGEASIPFARVDSSYAWIDKNIHAIDSRAEVGFGPFGFQIRRTHYDENEPDASLEVTQYHGLYRMSFGDHIEIDFGYGKFEITGVENHSASSWTIPVQLNPSPQFGFEFRPSWTNINGNDISDNEMAISIGGQYWAVRGGHRWLKSPDMRLDGPFLGISVRL